MKKIRQITVISIISLFLFTGSIFAVDVSEIDLKAEEVEYTDEYKEYLELSEEEKSKYIEPRRYDINSEVNSTNEALLKNEKISLNNLMTLLKSSNTSTEKNFSLKTLIPNNLKIRNQGTTNTCWAFATLSSLETNLALKNYFNKSEEKIYDYSERHMAYAMTQSFKNNQVNKYGHSHKVSEGGTVLMAMAYLTDGQGAINEQSMPFVDTEEDINLSEIQNKEVQTTVNNIIYFNCIDDYKTASEEEKSALISQMKEHISTNGSINASIYAPDGSEESKQYIDEEKGAIYVNEIKEWTEDQNTYKSDINHAVSIVGWDDEYSKENFTIKPQNNGAWIVRNSWGEKVEYTFDDIKEIMKVQQSKEQITEEELTQFLEKLKQQGYTVDNNSRIVTKKVGDDGFFYISYEDVNIYRNMIGIVSADDKKTYDNLYQLDDLGANDLVQYSNDLFKTNDIFIANVFKRDTSSEDYLTSIGFTNLVAGTYEVYINPNGKDKSVSSLQKAELTTGNEITLTAGYNKINLKNPYKLTGENFVIALKIKATGSSDVYVTIESNKRDKNAKSNAGESFLTVNGYSNDTDWLDVANPNETDQYIGNFCIKALTNKTSGEQKVDPVVTVENSNYKNAKATIGNISLDTEAKEFKLTLIVEGIEVKNPNDSYKHYFYLSTSANKTANDISRWSEIDESSFVKQPDGTYNLTLTINSISQLLGLRDEAGDKAYVYIKEEAMKGSKTSTLVSNPIEIIIDTEEVDVSKENNNNIQKINNNSNSGKSAIDKTVATSRLPHTGAKTLLIIGLIIFVVFIISYIRTKNMKDIK